MHRATLKQNSAPDAIAETAKPIARQKSGCHPSEVDIVTDVICIVVPYVFKTPAYLENLADNTAFRLLRGF